MIFNDFNLIPTHALKQYWNQQNFNYITSPRPDSGVMIIAKGKIDFVTKAETLSARTGDIIFLPKDCYYEVIFHTDSGPIVNYLANFLSDTDIWETSSPLKIAENALPNCLEAFRNYVRESRNPEISILRRKGMLYMLLDTIMLETNNIQKQNSYILEEAKNFLHKNPNCSISEIATRYAISESGFRKLFKDKFGMSPVQYRKEAQMARAIYLLESTEMSTSEIADQLGFYDTAYFCKCFQAHTGLTPKQYSQSRRI